MGQVFGIVPAILIDATWQTTLNKEKNIMAKRPPKMAKVEAPVQFTFLPIQEATNNLEYYRLLLVNHFNLNPITCY